MFAQPPPQAHPSNPSADAACTSFIWGRDTFPLPQSVCHVCLPVVKCFICLSNIYIYLYVYIGNTCRSCLPDTRLSLYINIYSSPESLSRHLLSMKDVRVPISYFALQKLLETRVRDYLVPLKLMFIAFY